jgi:hypothetical protein
MNNWKHWWMRLMSSNLHCPWFNWAADWRRNYVRSTGACAVPPCNLFLPYQPTRTTPWDHVVRITSRNQGCLYTRPTYRRPVLLGEFRSRNQGCLYTRVTYRRPVPLGELPAPMTQTPTADFRNTIIYGISTNLSGKTFKSAKVLWGTSQDTFNSWNRRHKVKATQGCSSSDFGTEPISTNQWW